MHVTEATEDEACASTPFSRYPGAEAEGLSSSDDSGSSLEHEVGSEFDLEEFEADETTPGRRRLASPRPSSSKF